MSSSFIKNIAALQLSLAVGSVFSFAFYLVGRYISQEDFGVLTAMLTIINFGSVFQLIIKNIIIKDLLDDDPQHYNYSKLFKYSFIFEVFVWLVFVFVSVLFLKSYMRLDNVFPLLITSVFIFANVGESIILAILESQHNFKIPAFISTLESFLKFFLGIVIAIVTKDLDLVLIGVIASHFIGFGVMSALAKESINQLINSPKSLQKSRINIWPYIMDGISFLSLTSIYSVDIIILRNNLLEKEVGLYGAMLVLGRLLYFINMNIARVYYPKGIKTNGRELVVISSMYVATLIGIGGLLLATRNILANKAFGVSDKIDLDLMFGLLIFVTTYSVVYTIANLLIINKSKIIWGFISIAAVTQIVLLDIYVKSIKDLIVVQNLFIAIVLIAILILYKRFNVGSKT